MGASHSAARPRAHRCSEKRQVTFRCSSCEEPAFHSLPVPLGPITRPGTEAGALDFNVNKLPDRKGQLPERSGFLSGMELSLEQGAVSQLCPQSLLGAPGMGRCPSLTEDRVPQHTQIPPVHKGASESPEPGPTKSVSTP